MSERLHERTESANQLSHPTLPDEGSPPAPLPRDQRLRADRRGRLAGAADDAMRREAVGGWSAATSCCSRTCPSRSSPTRRSCCDPTPSRTAPRRSNTIPTRAGSGAMPSGVDAAAVKSMLARYADQARAPARRPDPAYGAALKIGNTSFRPVEAQGRAAEQAARRHAAPCRRLPVAAEPRPAHHAGLHQRPSRHASRASGASASRSRPWPGASCRRSRRRSLAAPRSCRWSASPSRCAARPTITCCSCTTA